MSKYNEPWRITSIHGEHSILDCNGNHLCGYDPFPLEVMQRIVACVNACTGVPAEDFEEGAVIVKLGKD